jgi:phosphoserine phosphatase
MYVVVADVMKINKSEFRVAVDIDDTLIMYPSKNADTATLKHRGYQTFTNIHTGELFWARPSKVHIDLIKASKHRGYEVTVWSAAGWAHAEQIVKELGIEMFVDNIETKYTKLIDDLSPNEVFPIRIYLESKDE